MAIGATFGILFHIRNAKKRKDGTVPIYLRITIEGQRTEFAIKRYIKPERWNSKAGRAKGTNDESREINDYIHVIEKKIRKVYKELIDEDIELITGSAIINRYTGKDKKNVTLIETFNYHNKLLKDRVGKDYAAATITRYDTTLNHIKDFLKDYYNTKDIGLVKLDYAFAANLEQYFKVNKGCNHNTTMKYIKNVKRIVHFAIEQDWLEVDPFRKFKTDIKEVKREYLTEVELSKIESKEFKVNRLELVRDIFVFACYTGLAYIDIANLTKSNIKKGIDHNNWIYTDRKKTGVQSRVVILPKANEVIDKYADHPMVENTDSLLPIYSNQRMNSYLKEIADLCEIDKNLTFHLARHTFATTVTLKNGVSIETVSAMLGHKNIRTTQIYAKIVDRKIGDEMTILSKKLNEIDEPNEVIGTKKVN